jgi:hypothetical protein
VIAYNLWYQKPTEYVGSKRNNGGKEEEMMKVKNNKVVYESSSSSDDEEIMTQIRETIKQHKNTKNKSVDKLI